MKATFYFLVFSVFFISACRQNNKIENSDRNHIAFDTRTKIKWLAQWNGEGKKETLIWEIAREFCLLHQNFSVEVEFPYQMADIESDAVTFNYIVDSIVKMITTNTWPYDIMLCDADIYQNVANKINDKFWGEKYLVNFKNEKWFIDGHKQHFFDISKNTEPYGGIAPGTFIEGIWQLLYLSSEVENRLGIKVKNYDMNMTDFISYAKAVYQYNQSHADKITFITFPYTIQPLFIQAVKSALQKESADNREEALNALRLVYQEFEKLSVYQPLKTYVKTDSPFSLFHDKVLFTFHYSWVDLFWQKNNPDGEKLVHLCELPSIDGQKGTSYSGRYNCVFVVPKNAQNCNAAKLLMQFITSEETAEKWLKYSRCPTGLKNRISYSDFASGEYTSFSKHIELKYNDKLDETNLSAMLFKTDKYIDFQVEKILNGQLSAKEALHNVKTQIAR